MSRYARYKHMSDDSARQGRDAIARPGGVEGDTDHGGDKPRVLTDACDALDEQVRNTYTVGGVKMGPSEHR